MVYRHYLGIDPGVSGGFAVVDHAGTITSLLRMPEENGDIVDYLRHVLHNGRDTRAVLERVSASPQMGVVSAFTFGKGFGGLRMALVALAIPFEETTPRAWQKALGMEPGKKALGDKSRKQVTRELAGRLFPDAKLTHSTADALLLAEFGRKKHEGLL